MNLQKQHGFTKDGNIGDIFRLRFDIIDYANYEKMPAGTVLLVDLRKTFDSSNWSFCFCDVKLFWFWQFFDQLDKSSIKNTLNAML